MSGGIGILGNMGAEPQGTGILGGLHNFAADNSSSLIGMGLGLMSGDNAQASQGYMQGQRQDFVRRQQKLVQQQEDQKRVAAKGYAEKMGIDPRMADANPDGVLSLWQAQEQRRLIPKEPSEFEQLTRGMDPALVQQAKMAKLGLGGDKPTDEMREYSFDMQQRIAAGQPRQTFGEWKTGLRRAGATNVTTNVGGENSPLRKKLSEKEGESWAGMQDAAAVSGSTTQDFQVLDKLLETAPQGPVSGQLAQAFPGISTSGAAFQSIVKRIAPTLRAPGSGSTSDIEYDGMLQSLPRLTNKPEANRLIAETMKAKAAINVERGQVVTAFQNGQIDEATARQHLDGLNRKSIMSPQLKQMLQGVGGGATAPAPNFDRSALEAEARKRKLIQ